MYIRPELRAGAAFMSLWDPTNPLTRRAGRIVPALWPAPLIQGVRTRRVKNAEIHATIHSPETPTRPMPCLAAARICPAYHRRGCIRAAASFSTARLWITPSA